MQAWLTTHGPLLQGMAPRQALLGRALDALERQPDDVASGLPWESRLDSQKLQTTMSAAFAQDYQAQCTKVG